MRNAAAGNEFDKTRNKHIELILSTMIREADLWDHRI